jgi:hypothetical protein
MSSADETVFRDLPDLQQEADRLHTAIAILNGRGDLLTRDEYKARLRALQAEARRRGLELR